MTEPELPALYHASVANDLAEVERLLTAGADPNDGESIFHAAEKNHRAVIDLLIQHGGDISGAHAIYRNTPLFFLCGYRDDQDGRAPWYQGIAYLLERGADPNVPSGESRETPLHKIAMSHGAVATARLSPGAWRRPHSPQLLTASRRISWRCAAATRRSQSCLPNGVAGPADGGRRVHRRVQAGRRDSRQTVSSRNVRRLKMCCRKRWTSPARCFIGRRGRGRSPPSGHSSHSGRT